MAGRHFSATLGLIVLSCLPGSSALVDKVKDKALEVADTDRHIVRAHDEALVEQNLVICNAFAYKKPLDVISLRSSRSLTSDKPISYKECRELNMALEEGDRLEFKAGDLGVGTFFATGLPKKAASLLLIPHRKSVNSLSLAFDSHAFSDLQSPQIAVVDAYSGSEAGNIQIMDIAKAAQDSQQPAQLSMVQQRKEDLRYNSVIALNPGDYEVGLVGSASKTGPEHKSRLSVGGKTKYVVMRVGADDSSSKTAGFSQELVVFPQLSSTATTDTMQSSALPVMRSSSATAGAAIFAALASLL